MQQGINSYLKNQVASAKKSELVNMLYGGLIRFGNTAIEKMEAGFESREEAHTALIKMQKILAELMSCLNYDVDEGLCKNLFSLYNFMYLHLVDANMEHDTAKVKEVITLVEELRQTWREAMLKANSESLDTDVKTGIAVSG